MSEKESKDRDLPNFHQINENLFRGGQPTTEGLKRLARLGVKTIINFRDRQENVMREKILTESMGLRFINLRLSNWFKAKDSEIEAVLQEILKPENHPVFIHCKRGADRTGTIAAIYRMKFEGWTAKQANDEAKKHGIGWWQVWMKDYIHNYYKKLKGI
jgi:tyrosine-protein phosphatase SIW14